MDVTPAIPEDRKVIDSYGPGRFQVAGERYRGSVIVMPDRVVAWSVASIEEFSAASLEPVYAAEPPVDIVLLGCGARMALVKSSIRRQINERGISMDLMDTGAACRTYNILLAESRRVAAALIAV